MFLNAMSESDNIPKLVRPMLVSFIVILLPLLFIYKVLPIMLKCYRKLRKIKDK